MFIKSNNIAFDELLNFDNNGYSIANLFVHKAFENQALADPDSPATICENATVSYSELNKRANRLANYLIGKGISAERTVGICISANVALPQAILGTLKAGGAYVPLSPSYPPDRIRYILNDSNAKILLVDKHNLEKFSFEGIETISAEEIAGDDSISSDTPANETLPENAAYILYTSGSTGKPKGVVVEHRNLSYYLNRYISEILPKSKIQLPLSSSICFAAAVTQFFTPLILGRALNIIEPDLVRQPDKLLEWYSNHRGFGLYCVPTLWEGILSYIERFPQIAGSVPKCVYLSGEAVSESLVRRTFTAAPEIELWNFFGPTEAVANISAGKLLACAPVTIGKPLKNTKIYILDENLNPLEKDSIGEIYASGPGIARGYAGNDALTAEYFLNNHIEPDSPYKLYKTGDLGSFSQDGSITFRGRKDNQVKIRGYRIELGEIENAMLAHPNIRQVVCKLFDNDDNSNKKLAVFYVCKNGNTLNQIDIRKFLANILPDYYLPEVYTQLPFFPQLANGKINRKELKLPENIRPDLGYPYREPENLYIAQIISVWENALDYSGLGADDDFFDLGGNSLKILDAVYRINSMIGKKVPFGFFFEYPTPAKMSAALENISSVDTVATFLYNSPTGNTHNAGYNQRSLWLLSEMNKNFTAYNILFSIKISGLKDKIAIIEAINEICRRHAVLSSRFEFVDNELRAVCEPKYQPQIEFIDFTHTDTSERTNNTNGITTSELSRVLPLCDSPPVRFTVVEFGESRFALFMLVHHIIFDGISINVFFNEFCKLIASYGKTAQLESDLPKIQFYDFAEWQKKNINKAAFSNMLEFWKKQLNGANFILNLPADFPRGKFQSFEGNCIKSLLGSGLKEKISSQARKTNSTKFVVLLSAFFALLHKYTSQSDIITGSPVANRNFNGADKLIGYFVNSVALRAHLSDDITFSELISQMRNVVSEALDNSLYPFEKLLEEIKPERSQSHSPIFQVMFAYHEKQASVFKNDELKLELEEHPNPSSKFDFYLEAQELETGIELRLTYNANLFKFATATALLERFVILLNESLNNELEAIKNLSLLSENDKDLLNQWNSNDYPLADSVTIHSLFEIQANKTPQNIALLFNGKSLTYFKLNKYAEEFASWLSKRGIGAGCGVGVHLDNSSELVIALLGIMKTGAAYIPLDPYYPKDRIKYMLEDSQAVAVVSNSNLISDIAPSDCEIILYNDAEDFSNKLYSNELSIVPIDSTSKIGVAAHNPLAYIIYTSGSTGKPKGVEVPHRGAVNYLEWMKRRFPLNNSDRVLNKTSINFDISVWEIFLPLITGATLVMGRKEELGAPEPLADLIEREGITNVQFVPSALKVFYSAGMFNRCPSLKRVFSGGEKLSLDLQEQVFSVFNGELHNLYGPTEASIYACHWECVRNFDYNFVPIGKPLPNVKIYILDKNLRPSPIGLAGEIYIGGDILATGYRNKPELTYKAFLPNPFFTERGEKMYRTGDIGRFLPDGNIEYISRADRQIKVRGYRIEPGEIEHCLDGHDAVAQSFISARENGDDDTRLYAYIVPKSANFPPESEFREYLKRYLPDFMLPAAFIKLDALPLLPNGKINANALPEPETHREKVIRVINYYRNNYEEALALLWKEALGTDNFTSEDNFYDVGGHSLLMIKIKNMIEEKLKMPVSIMDLFQYPNIKSLAEHFMNSGAKTVKAEFARRAQMKRNKLNPNIKNQILKKDNGN